MAFRADPRKSLGIAVTLFCSSARERSVEGEVRRYRPVRERSRIITRLSASPLGMPSQSLRRSTRTAPALVVASRLTPSDLEYGLYHAALKK